MIVFIRILIGAIFTCWLLFTLISCDEKRREITISENNKFCGYFIGFYEHKGSRSSSTLKYAKIKNDNSIKQFLLTYQTTGLDNLVIDQEVYLTYYIPLISESSAIHISSK